MQKLIKILQKNIILFSILIFGGTIRIIGLDTLPSSLNWDEVSHGYNAYSILMTGRDEWGEKFPTIFRAYGDYKLPGYIYTTVPRVAIFGLNEFSVRLTSATAGTLLILATYLLVIQLFKTKSIGILAALFVAIEPWSFFLSRTAVEANLALFFIVAGVWFTLNGLKDKKWWVVLGALLLGLSVWTYNSARIFVPLLLVSLIIIHRYEIITLWKFHKKLTTCYLLLSAFFFLPMLYQLADISGQARYKWVAILDEGAIVRINTNLTQSNLPAPLPALLHNKITYFSQEFLKNYIGYFSPNFLFFKGGSQYQFSVPGKGLFYPVEFIFVIVGLAWVIKNRSRESIVVLIWLLLSPVAASLTRESQHALRSIIMMPIPQVLTAIGLVISWKHLKNFKLGITIRYIFAAAYVVGLLYFIESYTRTYIGTYRYTYSWSWQYGYKEMVSFVKDNYDKYDQIIITKKYGEPHEFILFYWSWNPEKYRNDPNLIRFGQSDWFWVDRFDKFYFVNEWQIPRVESGEWRVESGGEVPLGGRTLLVTDPGNYPSGWTLIKTINFLDEKPAFEILESKNI